jgi:serine/threonine-protein kinase
MECITPSRQTRDILLDAANGLAKVHSIGLLHRDIKPSNLMLAADGKRVKIGDFGLVTDDLIYGMAPAINRIGYQFHAAPEVIRDKMGSVQSDVWAFGMTAYRLLHGRVFWEQNRLSGRALSEGRLLNRLHWLEHIPLEWRKFVSNALHEDPVRRTASADELIAQLHKLPVLPDWSCTYSDASCIWVLKAKDKKFKVFFERDPRIGLPNWYVTSYPQQKRDDSPTPSRVTRRSRSGASEDEVLATLQSYFANHHKVGKKSPPKPSVVRKTRRL